MKEDSRPLLPLYVAAFVVLFCGISAVNSTVEDAQLTFFTTMLLLLGVVSSIWMRVQGADQRIIVWLASGMAAVLFVMQPFFGQMSRSYSYSTDMGGFSSSSIGVVLAWATVLFSFTLLSNYSLLFSVVPSMALIGLMSSENLNPEMVTYFIGFVLSTVFLMGYQAHLDRARSEEGETRVAAPSYRPFVILSAAVVAGAFLIGQLASAPLKFVGKQVFSVAANNLPNAPTPLLPLDLRGTDDLMSLSGQTPDLSNAEVMRVKSRAAQYWRGAVYESYNGISWKSDSRFVDLDPNEFGRGDSPDQNVFRLDPNDLLKTLKGRELLIHSFTTSRFINTLYGAGEPRRFEGPMEHIRATSQLAVRSDWGPNNLSYQVTSLISHATPDDLRKAPSWNQIERAQGAISPGPFIYPMRFLSGPGFDQFQQWSQNIDLPQRIPPRVRDKAEQITRGKTTDYDRALAVEQHLKQNYTYTLEPPLLPQDKDAADFFLFDARSGYCEQFANAMAVMLRTLDIPARIAVGYAPGEFDPKTNEWVVRELDAHAWVEVFFPQYGWITFDPTGGVEPEQPGFSLKKVWNAVVRFINSREFLPTMVLISILGVFAYAVKSEAYDRYLRPYVTDALWRWRHKRSPDPRWAVDRDYRQFRKVLRRQGIRITPSQTPNEVREAALEKFGREGDLATPLERITDLYVEAAYSGRDLPPGSDRASSSWLRQLKEGLKTHARR